MAKKGFYCLFCKQFLHTYAKIVYKRTPHKVYIAAKIHLSDGVD